MSASQNTGIGISAGSNLVAGGNNIAIGAYTNFVSTGSSNQLNIGNWIYGHNGNIGIGVSNPTTRLDIAGQVKITGGGP